MKGRVQICPWIRRTSCSGGEERAFISQEREMNRDLGGKEQSRGARLKRRAIPVLVPFHERGASPSDSRGKGKALEEKTKKQKRS